MPVAAHHRHAQSESIVCFVFFRFSLSLSRSRALVLSCSRALGLGSGVCKKTLLQRRGPLGKISLKNAKAGAAEEFLPLGCMAKARVKGMFFSQTQVVLPWEQLEYWFNVLRASTLQATPCGGEVLHVCFSTSRTKHAM